MMMSDATPCLSRRCEGLIPAFKIAIAHHRSVLWHAGKSEVQINARAIDMRTMCRGIDTIRYRLECSDYILVNRIDLAPGARHFNRVSDQTLLQQVPPFGHIVAMAHPTLCGGGISSIETQICHDRLDGEDLGVHP